LWYFARTAGDFGHAALACALARTDRMSVQSLAYR
jgi:hypothetical protein